MEYIKTISKILFSFIYMKSIVLGAENTQVKTSYVMKLIAPWEWWGRD